MRKAACVFFCLLLVLPILAQPPTELPRVVVDNLSTYPIEYMHHILKKDGSFINSETATFNPGERFEMIVEEDVFRIITSYGQVRPPPLPGLWNQNNEWTVLDTGEAEASTYWTVDDDGFWLGYGDDDDSEEVLQCQWRTTGIPGGV